eukprot:1161305-Pelagomonas_calceolata.AAC.4
MHTPVVALALGGCVLVHTHTPADIHTRVYTHVHTHAGSMHRPTLQLWRLVASSLCTNLPRTHTHKYTHAGTLHAPTLWLWRLVAAYMRQADSVMRASWKMEGAGGGGTQGSSQHSFAAASRVFKG